MIAVRIRLHEPDDNLIHRFRNLGEELYLAFRSEKAVDIGIDAIDAATSEISFLTRKRYARRAVAVAEQLLGRHMLSHHGAITTEATAA